MISLWSMVKLTTKAALRSHIFQLLLVSLLLCVFLLPLTITGDGTAYGYIQISLKYSLEAVAFILSLSCVWLGCFSLSRDVESYQLHMVVAKPISRPMVWLGKFFGILIIHGILLLIASLTIYFMILWQFSKQTFSAEEKARIQNEVLVGRRVFYPTLPDIDALARQMLVKRLQEIKNSVKSGGGNVEVDERKGLADMRRQVIAALSEVKAGPANMHFWRYTGIPKEPQFLRFRMYVNKVSSKDQRFTNGLWNVVMDVSTDEIKDGKKVNKPALFPTAQYPMQYMTGNFHEMFIPAVAVSDDHAVEVAFINFDPEGKPLFFQLGDGPKLLVKVSGFFGNYMRAILVVMMRLVIFTGLACAAAAIMSMPTAVFMVLSYLLFGIFAQFLVGGGEDMIEGVSGFIGYWVSKVLLLGVIPMQNFEISRFIANGELIEFSFIGALFLKYFVFRALPLFLLGIYLYQRRELGLVIRK